MNHSVSTPEELIYKIALSLIPGIGDVLGKKLVAYSGGVEAVFRQKKSSLLRIPGIGNFFANAVLRQNVLGKAEAEIRFMDRHGIRPLFYLDENYPYRLRQCADSPLMLYYKGSADLNPAKVIGIVGTRNATSYGKDLCNELIESLLSFNVCIVSGLAYGIDICAHKLCLKNNVTTLGVLAHGLDVIYPSIHRSVSDKMIFNGGLLTDYPSRTKPDKENFPRRNRIVAGLCDALIVIESAVDGGSMITAEIANSYSRDVFAFPGRTNDLYSSGCNRLIRDNKAALIENGTDLIRMMGWETQKKESIRQPTLFEDLSGEEESIVSVMKDKGNVHIDELSALVGIPVYKISTLLLNMEFLGVLKSLPGKMYRLN
jgi:DNA processing protein